MPQAIHDVFLSYSRKDTDMMRRIRASLLSAGLSVWTDEGIKAGTELWINSIETAIEQSKCILVLLSPDAKASVWVKKELRYANIQGKKTFSILVEGDSKSAIPFELIGSQFVDIRTNYEAVSQKLLPDMCNYLGIQDIEQIRAELAHERRLNQELKAKLEAYETRTQPAKEKALSQPQAKTLGKQAFQKLNEGDYFGAIEDYTVALFLDADNEHFSSFTFYRARALRWLGNLELAQQELLRLEHKNGTFDEWVWWELAEIAEQLGNYEQAISIYSRLYHAGTDYEAYNRVMYLEQKMKKGTNTMNALS